MSVRQCRAAVANAEALFTAHFAQCIDRTQHLVGEVRAAATPLRVGVAAALGGAVLVLLRPRLGTLLKLPMVVGAVDSLVQHVGNRAAAVAMQDAGPPP